MKMEVSLDESNLEEKYVLEGNIAQALAFQDKRNTTLKEIKHPREVKEAWQAKVMETHPVKRLTLNANGEAIEVDVPDNSQTVPD
ncbi:hypothetical protein BGZ74_001501 [Mortierella antarctica]|nr:hypothetical protein BGZ74_001501 [Mortierella antarctica]